MAGVNKRKYRILLVPGISAFVLFWVLIGLGIWQLHRLTWKEAILAAIHTAEISAPVPLPANPTPFEKVIITGSWVPGKAALYGDQVHDGPRGPIPGGELIMPFQAQNGKLWLVDLGWVPQQKPVALAMPDGVTTAVGYLHAPIAPGLFAGADQPAAGLYYSLDPARMAAGMRLGEVAPFTLIAMGPLPPPGSNLPQPAQHLPEPPNNHYEYALEWFGFAGVLVFQFIFFARERLKDAEL